MEFQVPRVFREDQDLRTPLQSLQKKGQTVRLVHSYEMKLKKLSPTDYLSEHNSKSWDSANWLEKPLIMPQNTVTFLGKDLIMAQHSDFTSTFINFNTFSQFITARSKIAALLAVVNKIVSVPTKTDNMTVKSCNKTVSHNAFR